MYPPRSLPRLHPIYLRYTDKRIHVTTVVLTYYVTKTYEKFKIGGKVPPEEYVEA